MEALRAVGLEDVAERLTSELSFGQKKLLALACCIATEAVINLLDEPVAGIHPALAARIGDYIRQVANAGKLVVFTEHDLQTVRRLADLVLVMDRGEIVVQGKPEEALGDAATIDAFLR